MSLGRSGDSPAARGRRNYVTIAMVLCLMAAIGISATTYASTLQTNPDEIIDIKHEWLPIGTEAIQQFKDPQTSSNDASSGAGGGGGTGQGEGMGTKQQEPPPCSQGMVGILASLFPMLIPPCGPFYLLGLLLPLLLLLAAAGLTYWYRDRATAIAMAVYGWVTDRSDADTDESVRWPTHQPANDVHRAWVAMVERANTDRPWTRTPSETADDAVDAGMDSNAVSNVTGLFEEVRYGDEPVTEDRQERARDWRRRFEEDRG